MAHNLNFNESKDTYSFFSKKEIAWHGLGTIVEESLTAEEAIVTANLDYTVAMAEIDAKIKLENTEIEHHKIENRYATYRTDTNDIFGIVSNRYQIVQNKEAFSFFDSIVGAGKAIFETAGVLGNGETVFISAKLPDNIQVGKDVIDNYLLLTMGHDGMASIQCMFTPIRVVCNNTLSAALIGNKSKVSIRHTASAYTNLLSAKEILGISNKITLDLGRNLNAMSKVKLTEQAAYVYIADALLTRGTDFLVESNAIIFPDEVSTKKKNVLKNAITYFHQGVGQDAEECKGTMYGAYNAVTGYFQNIKEFNTGGIKDDTKKMKANLLGANYLSTNKAYDEAMQYVNTGLLS